jgi:integrase
MPRTGKLLIFEGPDGVGKSTLVKEAGKILDFRGIPYKALSFPGKDAGTLGWVVDQIHHTPGTFEINNLTPLSLQALHIAAHLDHIESRILPALAQGAWFILVSDTGMRPEEVFRIEVGNIDFEQKTIFNPFGKTKAARRTIPMTDNLSSLLRRRTKEAERLATPFVFPSPHNVQTPIGSVKKAHQAAMDRADIKDRFRLYDLRHTFATRAAASDMNLPTLAAILGHANI